MGDTSFSYSDGDVELEIEKLLNEADDLSADTDIAVDRYSEWPVRYHLSSIRNNCIRHLNFSGLDVVEFGAGMGAMSRFIAENARHLTVVEGSRQRFACLRSRLRDLHNWDGTVANYQNFTSDKKYHVACFLGVLEYAGKYLEGENPFHRAIHHAASLLTDDGVLLIAIENKNGLKYFVGASEDHCDIPFYGICGYPEVNCTKTFSRKEMAEMLAECGFSYSMVHHLHPDYKCARAVLTGGFMEQRPVSSANIVGGYDSEDYSKKFTPLFPERLAALSLARSGLLGEFSNSYLFIASRKENSKVLSALLSNIEARGIRGLVYTHGRKSEVVTSFCGGDTGIHVEKQYRKRAVQAQPSDVIENSLRSEPFANGVSVATVLLNYAWYGKRDEFLRLLLKFFTHSFERHAALNGKEMGAEAFDALVSNTNMDGDSFTHFDHEYAYKPPMTKNYFVFRNICHGVEGNFLERVGFESRAALYYHCCREFGIIANLDDAAERESRIQKELYRIWQPAEKIKKSFSAIHKARKSWTPYFFTKTKCGNKRTIKFLGMSFSYTKKKK